MIQGTIPTARSGVFAALVVAGIVAGIPAAHAFELTEPGSDIKVTWDNTVRYGVAFRTGGQNAALLGQPNNDDGDRNFNKGLISNKLELLTEFDVMSRQGFGLRVSGQGWYDTVYNSSNDNPGFAGGAFPNQTSVDYNRFTSTTRRMQGRDFQLRDAFVIGKFDAAEMPVTIRVGQHAQVWGESLFFASNAIAGGQSPFDINRLLADPTAQAKEFVLPVPQISGQIQVSPGVTVGAYYQFQWVRNTFPASGSYFSSSDIFGQGAETLCCGFGGAFVPRSDDMKPNDSGQGGVQLRFQALETDFGLYAIRFHDKTPQIVTKLGMVRIPGAPPFVPPVGPLPVGYYQAFNQGTTAYGVSASHTFGGANLAFEASVRHNQALSSSGAADISSFAPVSFNNSSNPGYAVGQTAHVNVSAIWSLEPGPLWREATFVGEAAWNRMLKCEKNCGALDPYGTRDALGLRMVFTPTYRQVAPGLDLSVPIGLGYSPMGRSLALGPGFLPPNHGGDFTIGLSGVYQSEWHLNLAYTHYYGKADTFVSSDPTKVPPNFTYGQTLQDRDFLTMTIRKSF